MEYFPVPRTRRSMLLAGLSLSALLAITTPISLHHGFGVGTAPAWADSGEGGWSQNVSAITG